MQLPNFFTQNVHMHNGKSLSYWVHAYTTFMTLKSVPKKLNTVLYIMQVC